MKWSRKHLLRDSDIFGHPVLLNFNRNGSFHKTSIGGVFSLFIKVLYLAYMGFLVNQMVNKLDDRSFTFIYKKTDTALEWHKTGVINYHQLQYYDQDGWLRPLWYNEEAKQYIDIRYAQRTSDYS